MSVEKSIESGLTGDSAVQALVGNGDSPETYRVFPGRLPQKVAFPAISYTRAGASRPESLTDEPSLEEARIQIDCWGGLEEAGGYSQAKALADAVRGAMQALGSGIAATFETDQDLYDERTRLHRVSAEYLVWSQQP